MTVYDLFRYWDTDLRPPLLAALRAMSPEQLRWKPAGWHSSALELADHICAAEWIWIYRNVLRRAPWGTRWQDNRFAGLEELLAYWQEIHAASVQWLQETPVSDLQRACPLPYADSPEAPLHWIVYHVVEHEAHHRGQVMLLMRMQGLTPPET